MMLREFFDSEKIEYFGELDIKDIKISDKAKMARLEEKYFPVKSVIVFIIPYNAGKKTTNLSVYAKAKDYHLYIKELSERANLFLRDKNLSVIGMADNSPIDERDALLKTGNAVFGKNGLCINEKYGSFFFIGEFFLPCGISPRSPNEIKGCMGCKNCISACPTNAVLDPERKKCLSLLTQKKTLTFEEEMLIKNSETKWGCDICQNVCPMNKNAELSPIRFFNEDIIDELKKETVSLPEDEFNKRAFSWRGKKVIERNLDLK